MILSGSTDNNEPLPTNSMPPTNIQMSYLINTMSFTQTIRLNVSIFQVLYIHVTNYAMYNSYKMYGLENKCQLTFT